MARGMSDMMLTMGMFFFIQKIDFKENQQNILYAQIVFAAVQIVILSVYAIIYKKSTSTVNNTVVRVPKNAPSLFGAPDPDAETESMTASEYDYSQIKKLITSSVFSIGLISFLFFKFGVVQPMVMQCFFGPKGLYANKLFKIYILGEDESKYPRPWAEENPLSMMPGFDAQQPDNTQNNNNDDVSIEGRKDKKSKKSLDNKPSNSNTTTTTTTNRKPKAKITEITEELEITSTKTNNKVGKQIIEENDDSSSEEEVKSPNKNKKKYL